MTARTTLIGVPYDASSSHLRGAAGAPPRVREALFSPAGNNWSELAIESIAPHMLEDAGDLTLPPTGESRAIIERAIRDLSRRHARFIAIGGDHSITYPIVRGLALAKGPAPSTVEGPLTILHVDAHPDLYDELDGDRFSHACPFARVMEEGLAARLVQVGIRTATAHQREQAARFAVEQIDMRAWDRGTRPGTIAGRIYVSLDLDGLDPAHAPGVSHREPGGLTVRDVLGLFDGLEGTIVGADVVELNPSQDPTGVTAAVAAKFVKELAARMYSGSA
jgi:agmatinase